MNTFVLQIFVKHYSVLSIVLLAGDRQVKRKHTIPQENTANGLYKNVIYTDAATETKGVGLLEYKAKE